MPRGGYQEPRNPAGASGPGKLSRRTDGGPAQKIRELSDAQYGEAATFRDLQQSAPLAQAPRSSASGRSGGGAAPAPPTTLDAPTERPDEDVLTGVGQSPPTNQLDAIGAAKLAAYAPALEALSRHPSVTPTTRNYIRALIGQARG